METFTIRRKFLRSAMILLTTAAFSTTKLQAQTATVSPPDQFVLSGVSTSFTATAVSGLGDNNADKQFIWTVTGPAASSPAGPVTVTITSGTTHSQSFTFSTLGEYTVSVKVTKVNGGGSGVAGDNVTVSADVTVVTANSPINCSSRFFVSHGSGGNYNDQTTLKNLSFSGSTITPNNFSTDPNGIGFNAIGISPDDGYLYGIRYVNSNTNSLIKVGAGTPNNVVNKGVIKYYTNPPTNTTTADINSDVFAGCFSATGTYFFIDQNNRFYKLSKAQLNGSRIASYIGSTGLLNGTGVNAPPASGTGIIDIAINPTNGKMYGISMGSNSSTNADYRVYQIDTTTGALTRKGSASGTTGQYPHGSSEYIASLFFIEDGTLYGYRSDGQFLKVDTLAPQNSTTAGTGPSYTYADGCSCSFRVGHTLTRTAFCPSVATPLPVFQVKIVISNSSGAARSGLTFSLPIGDPAKRFRYVQTAAQIKTALTAKGYADAATVVNLTTTAPATGTNYNTLNISGFKIPFTPGGANKDSFTLNVQFYTVGNPYSPVLFQSTIGNLPVTLGTTDKSGNGIAPQAPLAINFGDCGPIILASKLLSFSGNLVNTTAALSWETVTEEGVNDYIVQRSYNGVDFTDVGTVAARGQAGVYTFNDPLSVAPEKVFYRLKIEETDGFKYSGIVILRSGTIKGGIVVSPNPFSDNFQFTVNSQAAADMTYTLSTIDGRQIRRSAQRLAKGTNTFFVNDLNVLQTGVYILTVNTGDGAETIKLIKNKL